MPLLPRASGLVAALFPVLVALLFPSAALADTALVKDYFPGPAPSVGSGAEFEPMGAHLYYLAVSPTVGLELARTDGTAAGTAVVRDITPGPQDTVEIGELEEAGGTLFFRIEDELWRSDGTAGGTTLVEDTGGTFLEHLTEVGDKLYFAGGPAEELWVSDGTPAGTHPVKTTETVPPNVDTVTDVGGVAFFISRVGSDELQQELWRSDGTDEGTHLVLDGGPVREIVNLRAIGGVLYFGLYTFIPEETGGLWRSDGTPEGTGPVKQTGTIPEGPDQMTAIGGGTFLFSAYDAEHGDELWRSDGTEAGTTFVKDIFPGDSEFLPGTRNSSHIEEMAVLNGVAYFPACTAGAGGPFCDTELWRSDGTEDGTRRVKDILVGTVGSYPTALTPFNGHLYFTSFAAGNGLWRSDGTEAGTNLFRAFLEVGSLTAHGNKLYFVAATDACGSELWRTDGDPAGPTPVCSTDGGGGGGSGGSGGDGRAGGGGGGGAVDRTSPVEKLSGKKTQKLGKTVTVTVSCNEACTATANGTLNVPMVSKVYRLKKTTKSIRAGGKVQLKLRLSKKARKAAKRALKRHKRVRAKLKVVVKDAAGNKTSRKRTIKLKLH